MPQFPITALYTAFLAAIGLVLMFRVVASSQSKSAAGWILRGL